MLHIATLPTESLRKRSTQVDPDVLLSKDIQKLIKEMVPKMYEADGIGLAAPQVGNNIRICVVGKEAIPHTHKVLKKNDLVLVNPIWERASRKTEMENEGCLSVPGKVGQVKRFKDIHVNALDEKGNELAFNASKFFARVIQHEVDHLNGVLFIDKAKDVQKINPNEYHNETI